MNDRTLLQIGVVGSIVAALCCATPVLVILLVVLGLSAWVIWIDYVAIPALVLFLGVTVYALVRRRKFSLCATPEAAEGRRAER